MAKQNFGGVYANMEFPPYVWQEYPKHVVTGPHGKYTIVNTAAEEAVIRQQLQKDEDDAPAEPIFFVPDAKKEVLISRANELGVPINRKWSISKLESVIREKEVEIDNLPPENDITNLPRVEDFSKEDTDIPEGKSEEEYKDELIAIAKHLGAKNVSRLWGIPRLKSTILELNEQK